MFLVGVVLSFENDGSSLFSSFCYCWSCVGSGAGCEGLGVSSPLKFFDDSVRDSFPVCLAAGCSFYSD